MSAYLGYPSDNIIDTIWSRKNPYEKHTITYRSFYNELSTFKQLFDYYGKAGYNPNLGSANSGIALRNMSYYPIPYFVGNIENSIQKTNYGYTLWTNNMGPGGTLSYKTWLFGTWEWAGFNIGETKTHQQLDNLLITFMGNISADITNRYSYQLSTISQLSLIDEKFDKTGYVLTAWNTQRTGTGKSYSIDHIFRPWEISADITLHAQWEKQ